MRSESAAASEAIHQSLQNTFWISTSHFISSSLACVMFMHVGTYLYTVISHCHDRLHFSHSLKAFVHSKATCPSSSAANSTDYVVLADLSNASRGLRCTSPLV